MTKYSVGMQVLWRMAVQEAVAARHEFVESEHFLAVMTKGRTLCREDLLRALEPQGVDRQKLVRELTLVPEVLESAGMDPASLRRAVRARTKNGRHEHKAGEVVHRSERARTSFTVAEGIAKELGAPELTPGHLFLVLLVDGEFLGTAIMQEKGIDVQAMIKAVKERLAPPVPSPVPAANGEAQPAEKQPGEGGFLAKFGRDLTQAAREGRLGPFVGRRKELLQVIQVLARSTKSNPVLVGEPGVGKTAIVEAPAMRASQGKEPKVLGGKRIIEISVGNLTAGAKYVGDIEARVQGLLAEVKTTPGIILFIDELHLLIGAGRGGGSAMDAANLMKPALARGEFQCIGATTIAEYRKYIEKDPALERRFEKVIIAEPSRDETLEMLKGLKGKLEAHHQVRITDEALAAAVDLSVRFDPDRRLPDKAIDLLDLAGAQVCVPQLSIRAGAGKKAEADRVEVTERTIAAVLSERVGVPADVILGSADAGGQRRLLGMEAALRKRVIGQDDAVARISRRLVLAHASLSERRGPLGVFLLLGPSGSGKTELAKALAEFLFGSDTALIRLDMSEFMEAHYVARLVGSPPGYIGSEEEGQLTGKLRTQPYSVVLLDEVEKAHPKVFDVFLQVFDEGRLTDAKGRTVDAKNAVFIMTSNIAGKRASKRGGLGFGADQAEAENKSTALPAELSQHFRTEFLNRIDEIIPFKPLSRDNIREIARNELNELAHSLQSKHGKHMTVEDAALDLILERGYSEQMGVRNLKRTVQELVGIPLSRLLLEGVLSEFSGVTCVAEQGRVVLKPM